MALFLCNATFAGIIVQVFAVYTKYLEHYNKT